MDDEKAKIKLYNETIATLKKGIIGHAINSALLAIFAVWFSNQYLPNTVEIVRAFSICFGIMAVMEVVNVIKAYKLLIDTKRLKSELLKHRINGNTENERIS